MIDTGAMNVGGRRNAGSSGGGGGGGVSQQWVDENYISKAFFARLFTIHSTTVTQDDPNGEVVEPNDLETEIASIQSMVGHWTEQYLSALGQGSGGGGGGGAILTEPLASINEAGLGTPSGSNKVICWDGSNWVYKPYATGSGTVTSVSPGTGLSSSTGGAITTSGTLSISSDYQTKISHGETAYGWGNHANAGYLTGITAAMINNALGFTISGNAGATYNLGTMASNISTMQGYFDADGAAKKAVKLKSAVSLWGNSFDGSDGIGKDANHRANLVFVGSISMNSTINGCTNIDSLAYFDTTNSRVGINTSSPSVTLDINGQAKTTRLYLSSDVYLEYDSTNHGIHVVGAGLYADTYVSSLSAGSGGGSGSGITMDDVWTALAATAPSSSAEQINLTHLTQALSYYATKDWANSKYVALTGDQDIAGKKTFTGDLTVGSLASLYGIRAALSAYLTTGQATVNTSYNFYVNGTSNLNGNTTINGLSVTVETPSVASGVSSVKLSAPSSKGLWCYSGTLLYASGTWINTSDVRKKDIFDHVEASVKQIAEAPIFNYRMKGGNSENLSFGSSAQYWQKIFPTAVKEMPDGFLGLDYSATALAAAVMTARKVVDHEERIKALEQIIIT